MSHYRFETLQLHAGQEQPDPATGARAVPIYATASYVFANSQQAADRFSLAEGGNIYGRLTNSTQEVFERRMAALEGGAAALAVASGAAAIAYTIQALAKQGEHIVAQKTIYGGTSNLLAHTLPLYGITASFVDVHDLAAVEQAIRPNTKALYTETLSLRLERHIQNTQRVVEYLSAHPMVEKVHHPSLPGHPDHALYQKYFPRGGGSIFTFQIRGGRAEAFRFIDQLQIFSLLANVADVKSLVIHPASTTHSQLTDAELADAGIYQNTIRLSIGTEHIDDILEDLDQAFRRAAEG